MARAKVVHSSDAVTVVFEGDKRNPEPTHGIIKFPGGFIEVARHSNGSYWVHASVEEDGHVVESRIDYSLERARRHGVQSLPHSDEVRHFAVRVARREQEG